MVMQAINKGIVRSQKEDSKKAQLGRPGSGPQPGSRMQGLIRNKEMQAALGSGAIMLIAWGVTGYSYWLSVMLYIVSYTLGGWSKAREGVETLLQERDLDVNLLMIAASLGAAAIGYWNEGAMLIFIFALSGALESMTNERSSRDISQLVGLQPETAVRMTDEGMELVSIEQLIPGDLILVRPGELIPADGIIERGRSAVNQSSITGESVPIDKTNGAEVYAGTVNGEGVLYVKVSRSAEGSVFAKIVKLVEEAKTEIPQSQRFIKRFEGVYAKAVVGITVLILVLAPLLFGWSWQETFYKAMVFLVVASPCALVSSIMPAMLSAISNRARRGILFKSGSHMENMALTSVVAFDKTGTLTEGTPQVTDWFTADGFDRRDIMSAVAAIESLSKHPLAKAVVAKAEEEGLELPEAEHVSSITGWGMEGRVEGVEWRIGRSDVLAQLPNLAPHWQELRTRLEQEGKTVSIILREDALVGLIGARDELRPQAREAIRRLRTIGVKVAMLSGDHPDTAAVIAREAVVDWVYGGLTPEQKVEHVRQLRERCGHVVMVGDGVNDAPALAAATVGMGMGMNGSGAALEVADVVLMNDGIEEIASTIIVARRAARIVKQNMIFAILVILVLITANFLENIALPLGVIGHEGSTLLVILNGLRLLRPVSQGERTK
ncbi:Zinc-transporting ATPase [compost metagenome]